MWQNHIKLKYVNKKVMGKILVRRERRQRGHQNEGVKSCTFQSCKKKYI